MMKPLLFVSSVLVSHIALAATSGMTQIVRPAIMEEVTVQGDNGGFNPDFGATKIIAKVMVASNDCEAQGLEASLIVHEETDGSRTVESMVTGEQASDLMCNKIYAPVYAQVSVVIRDQAGYENSTIVKRVYDAETDVTLAQLITCNPVKACTLEYDPQNCQFNGVNFEGSNSCVVETKIQSYACVKGLEVQAGSIQCSNNAPEAPVLF